MRNTGSLIVATLVCLVAGMMQSCAFSVPDAVESYGFDSEVSELDALTQDVPLAVDMGKETQDGAVYPDVAPPDATPCVEPCEQCNGVDDDGDGQIDESLNARGDDCLVSDALGECASGREDCVEGVLQCVSLNAARAELCDELDNDCDGSIDEEVLNACGVCGPVPDEVCDDADNDCDGSIDEGVLNACGVCGAVPEEVCDGVDNDCNGTVDDPCPCVAGTQEMCGSSVGICEPGVRLCTQENWGPCMDQVGPQDESCNGLDDDCDGRIDEELTQVCGSAVGRCQTGESRCEAGDWTECVGEVRPVPESRNGRECDGIDNDCDGSIDETFSERAITCGQGACQEGGVQTCMAGQIVDNCRPGMPAAEVCDNIDNDCNGVIDEQLAQGCGIDVGACRGGTQVCEAGVWGACGGGQIGPAREVCDNIDNDCDGRIDERLTLECGTDVGACQAGTQDCNAGEWGACGGGFIGPVAEVCDDIDNDCDGSGDEGLILECGSENGLCRMGTQVCASGQWGACGGEWVGPAREVCDGEDNDCDGQFDEGVSRPCGTDVGLCTRGTETCTDGVFGACLGGVQLQVEGSRNPMSCDGEDNDCDGRVDEDFGVPQCCLRDPACQGQLMCVNGVLGICNPRDDDRR